MKFDYNYGNTFYNYYDDYGIKSIKYKIVAPLQHQKKQPGLEYVMEPRPLFDNSYMTGQVIHNKGVQVLG